MAEKPQPVVVKQVCSICDQSWDDHGENPTMEDCITVLKKALAARPPVTYLHNGTGTLLPSNWSNTA